MRLNEIEIGAAVDRCFFLMPAEKLARSLIGKVLARQTPFGIIAAEIIEAEAYLDGIDESSHSFPGLTARNAPMFEEGGCIYVYQIYGVHHCVNIVADAAGIGAAVLIRAARPIAGIDIMSVRRPGKEIRDLCKGPGNLAKAFSFTKEDNFKRVNSSDILIHEGFDRRGMISVSERIGITKSTDLKLRFFMAGSKYISGRPSLNGHIQ